MNICVNKYKMPNYYILVKRKGAKKWRNVIPAKPSVPLSKLRSNVRNQIRKGYTYRIINKTQLNKMFSDIINLKKKKKPSSARKKKR